VAALADLTGVEVLPIAADAAGRIDLAVALNTLGSRGLTRLLVEGGGQLAAALLDADLVDELLWHRAPILPGGGGVPAIGPLSTAPLAAMRRWRRTTVRRVGDDLLETWRPADRG
jgi:diaminohydroxyphosphoribosylaminopyrimidine deaminase/5-amino-6-(5-phosphoribosylamino)uracil reductase